MRAEQLQQWVATFARSSDQLLTAAIDEQAIVNSLRDAASHAGLYSAARVNLWNLVDSGTVAPLPRAHAVLKTYRHPLQPDIDLLTIGPDSQISIHEVKLIRWDEQRPGPIAPVGRLYDGLGQALAASAFGADYCYLWHVWVHPRKMYRAAAERSEKHVERLEDGWVEIFHAYGGIVKGLLENYRLPLGYVFVLVIKDEVSHEILITPFPDLWRAAAKLGRSQVGQGIRPLLMKALAKSR